MNAKKITIVTGFFDCKRGERETQKRSNDEYIKYFECWARINNDVVIFGNEEITQKALEVRKKFGKEKQTKIVIVENPADCDKELLEKMEKVENDGTMTQWRQRANDISNQALYDYVVFLKCWMLKYTAQNFPDSGMLAWIDFGFGHGGDCYSNPKEFDYLWEYPFEKNKVHIFTLKPLHKEVGILKLLCMTDAMMSGLFVCDTSVAAKLYDYARDALKALISLDAYDDDQMIITMAYKCHPELFCVHQSENWCLSLKECGGEHLSIKQNNNKKSVIDFLKRNKIRYIFKYLYAHLFWHTSVEKYEYIKRISKVIRNYN